VVELDVQSAKHTRDGLAKTILGALFGWAVGFINTQLAAAGTNAGGSFIGLLDIFGFESFAVNSFEQLCINFANEKLQAAFNWHVFAEEQRLYKEEGVSCPPVAWDDNAACLALIADKSPVVGILHMIDDVSRGPKTMATDAVLNSRLHEVHQGNSFFPRLERKLRDTCFAVRHYAGDVTYTIDGFLGKNNDTLSNNLTELVTSSKRSLLSSFFTESLDSNAAADGAGPSTAPASSPLAPQQADSPRFGAKHRSLSASSLAHAPRIAFDQATPEWSQRRPSGVATSPSKDGAPIIRRAHSMAVPNVSIDKPALSRSPLLTSSPGTPRSRRSSFDGGQRSRSSVGVTFKVDMNKMVEELDSTRCNFVRCIKPNLKLTPGLFDRKYVMAQLTYTGLLQCCKLLKHGYPTRIAYKEVALRYSPMLPRRILEVPCLMHSERFLTRAILYAFEVPPELYQCGETRLFFRAGGVAALDEIRSCDMSARAPQLIARVHRWVALHRWRLAIAHTLLGLRLVRLHRAVIAQRRWLFAVRVLRSYLRSFKRLYLMVSLRLRRQRAAVRITALIRAFGPRQKFLAVTAARRAEKAARERAAHEAAATTRLQAACFGFLSRRAYRKQRTELVEAKAATLLQAVFCGFLGRQASRKLRAELVEAQAATRLQAACLGFVSRQAYRKLRTDLIEGRAATLLQAVCCGLLSRQAYRKLRIDLIEGRAATRLQAACLGFVSRQAYRKLRTDLIEGRAATLLQAVCCGFLSRQAYRKLRIDLIEGRAATRLQAACLGFFSRQAYRKRRLELFEQMTPAVLQLQRWWRVVLSEMVLHKLRNVVTRAYEPHRRLVAELTAIYATLTADEAALACGDPPSVQASPRNGSAHSGSASARGSGGGAVAATAMAAIEAQRWRRRAQESKKFDMMVSLKVGLPPGVAPDPCFAGSRTFSMLTMSLKRNGGTYFRRFFSDPSNVDTRDDDGHYEVHRSWKHFGAIHTFMREGACDLPGLYVPATTYDNRPASSEADELLEFAREAAFYGMRALVELAVPKLLLVRYGDNTRMLESFRARGLLA